MTSHAPAPSWPHPTHCSSPIVTCLMDDEFASPMEPRLSATREAISSEIAGLRQGVICAMALLVNLLEERGTLEEGVFHDCLVKALQLIDADAVDLPETRLLLEFVKALDEGGMSSRRIQ